MADMMKGTHSYQGLAEGYGNFFSPVSKIKINGRNVLDSLSAAISDLRISLSRNSVSIASFQVEGAYDEKSHSFSRQAKDAFQLGSLVEIEIGYRSKTSMIYKGFVASRGVEFQDSPSLSVTLADARKLMMLESKQRYCTVKKYSDAFREVMKNYSRLCSVEVDDTSDDLSQPLSQNGTDYDFIRKKIIKDANLNREFFILGEKAYFRKPSPKTDIIMTVQYGRELLSFSQQEEYGGMKVKVAGYDAEKGKKVGGSAQVDKAAGQRMAMPATPQIYLTSPKASTEQKAKRMAADIAAMEKQKRKSASAQVIGIPELVQGRYIKVDGMDSLANGVYYIEEVDHAIGSSGFTTSLRLSGEA